MQNWAEHKENHERFVKSCLDQLAVQKAPASIAPLPTEPALQSRCETAVQPAAVQS
jgi:hypothetical protein